MSGKGKGKFSIIKKPTFTKMTKFQWDNKTARMEYFRWPKRERGPPAGRTSQQFSDGSIRFIDWQEVDNKIIPRGIHTVFGDPGPKVNIPWRDKWPTHDIHKGNLTYQKCDVYDDLGKKLPKSRIQVFHHDTVVDEGSGLVVYSKYDIPISHSFDDKPASILFDTKGNVIYEAWFHNGVAIRKANPCYPQAILRRNGKVVDAFWTVYGSLKDMPNDSDYKKPPSPKARIELANDLGRYVSTRRDRGFGPTGSRSSARCREERNAWMRKFKLQEFVKEVIKLQKKKGIETLKKHLRVRTAMKKTNKRLAKKFFSEIFSYL